MSAKIVEKYNVCHISTGDIFRSEIGNQTELGMMAKSYMDKGLLVPDEVTNQMVKSYLENLEDKKNGFLLDGYPRTIDQAKAFDALSEGSDLAIDTVIAMELDFSVLRRAHYRKTAVQKLRRDLSHGDQAPETGGCL